MRPLKKKPTLIPVVGTAPNHREQRGWEFTVVQPVWHCVSSLLLLEMDVPMGPLEKGGCSIHGLFPGFDLVQYSFGTLLVPWRISPSILSVLF